MRKTARGKVISQDIVQINLKVLKQGERKLSEIFEEQNKGKIKENRKHKRKQKISQPKEEIKSQEESA